VEIVLLVFTIPTYWDGDKCSEDADLVLYSARDGIHLKSQNETCLQDDWHQFRPTSVVTLDSTC
jgi:hypothetical protein